LAYRGCRRKSRHSSATEPFLPPLLALGLVTRFAALSHLSPIGTLDLELTGGLLD
jgi:hypothetical protein